MIYKLPKRFLCGLGLWLFASALLAQQFKAGILAGIVTSQVDGDTYAGYDRVGAMAGGFVSKNISANGKWNLSFELTYIQKGSRKVPHPDKGDLASYSLSLNYAEVPLLVTYNFSTSDSSGGERLKFAIEGGIGMGALVRSKESDANGLIPAGGIPFQKADYSIIVGLDYLLTKHLVFNVRTEYSLVPVRKFGTAPYYQNWTYRFLKPGYYNNMIVFVLRYRF